MIPVLQTLTIPDGVTDPEALPGEERGNCFQAAIASLLELPLDDVPHFVALGKDAWWTATEEWFAARGVHIAWQPICEHGWLPLGLPIMVTGRSPRGAWTHVVIYQDWELLHDPHPSGAGIVGRPTGAYYLLATPGDPAP